MSWRRSQEYRRSAFALVALILLVFGAVSFLRRLDAVAPLSGVQWVQATAGPIALEVVPGTPIWQAGLRPGDLLLRINGRSIESAIEASELDWQSALGRPVGLTLRRGMDEFSLEFVPEWGPRREPYAYLAIVGLAFWLSGLFVAWRWPNVRGGAIYTLLAFAMFAQLSLSHTGVSDRLDWVFYWSDLIAGALIPALLFHLGVVLARRTVPRPRIAVAAGYTVCVGSLLGAIWVSPGALGGALRFADPVLAVELRDRLEPLLLALSLLLTMRLIARAQARTASVLHRHQQRWLLWGLGLGFGPFVLLYAVPWALGAADLPSWALLVAVIPLLLVPVVFTAALARYRLSDLDLIVLRGFAEVTAMFCAFGIYAATVFLLREGIDDLLHISRSGTRYVGLLAMALTYPRVRSSVRVGVERAFYRRRYSYRATLLTWARELNAETDLEALIEGLRSRIRETLGVPIAETFVRTGDNSFAALVRQGSRTEVEIDDTTLSRLEQEPFIEGHSPASLPVGWASYIFPLKVKGRLRALLAISEREPPDEPLNSEDRALLVTLSAHAATAIEAARLVSEVRLRAEEIETLHARQARILESSAVGLLLLDRDGRIEAWNRALEQIYGLSRDEAIGKTLAELFPLHVVRRINAERRSGAARDEARIFRLSLVNRRGERVVANLSLSAVDPLSADPDAEAGATVVTFDDVSQRVKLEEQLLQQERLASLGMLAAGVAHEINTPLTGISSYTQMLIEECPEDDPRRVVLEKIDAQTHRAAQITHSLLGLASAQGALPESLDLNQTVREALALFEPQVRGGRISLSVELAADLPAVPGHKSQLQQVLLNLLLNARDALDGQGKVSVATRLLDGKAQLIVLDDGRGIAEEDLPRIFDPFFSTKERGRGTGLGLSISYGIIQDHGGDIRVDSHPGRFTRFTVELPLAHSAEAMA